MELACDTHTHTLFSRHAYSTIQENVAAAHEAGLELLGSADHFSAMLFNEVTFKNYQYFINLDAWPRVWTQYNVILLRACEADIVDLDGHLFSWEVPITKGINGSKRKPTTLKDRIFRGLDYVVASVHNADFTRGAGLAQTTDMYIHALQDPKVAIIGHPGRAGVPFDLDAVLTAAKDLGKMIEINEHSFDHASEKRIQRCTKIAERCAELSVKIAVNSDAPISCEIGQLDRTKRMLEQIHFPEELIATRSAKAFLDTLREAHVVDVTL